MLVFGQLAAATRDGLQEIVARSSVVTVTRLERARSSQPLPNSTDLEQALVPLLSGHGFSHHVRLAHPRTGAGFEYDFWRPDDRLAMEIMGYRADDEIYKDILKFHVHPDTRVGVVWVPRWKWISGQRTETNYRATIKALAFAESYMDVEALVALVYDWVPMAESGRWQLTHCAA
jgi:hypothetical protein